MDLSSASPSSQAAQPHHMSWGANLRAVLVLLRHISKFEDIMLTCKDLPLQQDTLQTLLEHLQGRRWVVKPQKIQGPGTTVSFRNHFVS